MQNIDSLPIVTIDGPSGVGKGTVAKSVALYFKFHLLNSGAIYRGLAMAASSCDIKPDQEQELIQLAQTFNWRAVIDESGELSYKLDERDVSADIQTETLGAMASKLAILSGVRQALLQKQRDFLQKPGLVAEGRDMGTVVFPYANTKIFLTASVQERVNRRHKQLKKMNNSASINDLEEKMYQRDMLDCRREVAPLSPASDAVTIDTTNMGIEDTCNLVIERVVQSLDINTHLDAES